MKHKRIVYKYGNFNLIYIIIKNKVEFIFINKFNKDKEKFNYNNYVNINKVREEDILFDGFKLKNEVK